jgi:hypothetical protein
VSKRLIVHIGRSKTGTTSFQQTLRANRDLLAVNGVQIPPFFNSENHGALALAFSAQPGRIGRGYAVENEKDRFNLQQELGRSLSNSVDDGNWVMTSEHIGSKLRSENEIQKFLTFLANHFDEVHILAVVRRPDDLAASAYAESIKSGRTWDFDAEYARKARRFFDHYAFANLWKSQLLPQMSFKLIPFQKGESVTRLFNVIFKTLNMSIDFTRNLEMKKDSNIAMSREAIQFLRLINPMFPPGVITNRMRRQLISTLTTFQGSPLTLTTSVYQFFLDKNLLTGGLEQSDLPPSAEWSEWFSAPKVKVSDWNELDAEHIEELHTWCENNGIPTRRITPAKVPGPLENLGRKLRKVAIRWRGR